MTQTSDPDSNAISSDMILLDILSHWPATEPVFRRYDEQAGVCICCNCLFDTVTDVAAKYSLDSDVFLSEIQKAAGGNPAASDQTQRQK